MSYGKAVAILGLGVAVILGGIVLTRNVVVLAGEAGAERLHRSILEYVAEQNPRAPISAFAGFPGSLVEEAQRAGIDHCLALAQAEIESTFRHDAVGAAGEIGLFQILPSTAAMLEPVVGPFKRPVLTNGRRDLGDLGDPIVSTRFAMAYMRDILSRRSSVREALTEYNGGPRGRQPHYYRIVMGTYVEILGRPELRCRYREVQDPPLLLTFLARK